MTTQKHAILREHAYFQTGGSCEVLYLPESLEELQEVRHQVQRDDMPFYVLGAGTNSLLSDENWPGAVIGLSRLAQLRETEGGLYAEAGVDNTTLAERAHEAGLAGAAWMNRLPGQIGGTVRMNARCYGGEISQIVRHVITIEPDGSRKEFDGSGVFRGYKDTHFMTSGSLVAAAHVALSAGERQQIRAKMDACAADRQSKRQFDFPSCGCVFKNDHQLGVPSGMMLEAAGAKSLSRGGARVSPHHANFVFNNQGTARDILELTFEMRESVYRAFGVWMEYEMEFLGHLPDDLLFEFKEQRKSQIADGRLQTLREQFQSRGQPIVPSVCPEDKSESG